MRKALATTAVIVLAAAGTALAAQPMLTPQQAHGAARLALENSLGALAYRSAGSAESTVGRCRVRGRRATCPGRVSGTVVCRVRLRVLVAGTKPASDPDARLLVWSDRIRCR